MKLSFFIHEKGGKRKKVNPPPDQELEPYTLTIISKSEKHGIIPLTYIKKEGYHFYSYFVNYIFSIFFFFLNIFIRVKKDCNIFLNI